MRSFVNDVAPDPLAYAGQKREPILVAVTQSICWVVSRSWSELPELTEGQLLRCRPAGLRQPGAARRLRADQPQPGQPGDDRRHAAADQPAGRPPTRSSSAIADNFATRDIQVFMLSNQLPLLEAGREGPAGHGPDRRLLRAGRRPSPGGSSPRPSSSRSPTRTT